MRAMSFMQRAKVSKAGTLAISVAIASLVVSTLVVATGGAPASASGSSAAGVKYADSVVAKYSQPPSSWKPAGGPINVASLKGESIWVVVIGESIPVVQEGDAGLQAAATLAGINLHICDAQLTPSGAAACISQAIDSHPNAIITNAIPISYDQPGFSAIESAGIPLVYANSPALAAKGTDKVAFVPDSTNFAGTLEADWTIADSGGKAHALVMEDTDAPITTQILTKGFAPQFKQHCPDCTLKVVGVETTQFANLPPLTSTALAENPNVDYVVPTLDAMTQLTLQGVTTAGAVSRVKGVTGSGPAWQMIQAKNFIVADVESSQYLIAWLEFDQALRMLLHAPVVQNEDQPWRIFTAKNVDGVTLRSGDDDLYMYGLPTAETIFGRLWHVKTAS